MKKNILTILLFFLIQNEICYSQLAMNNVGGRKSTSLNGKWKVLIDPTGIGYWREVWKEKKPEKKTDFFEYSFEGSPEFAVPGDFNTQLPEMKWFEGTVWYKTTFQYKKNNNRLFLHFGAVNYLATVFLNGEKIGEHEGGFTPFQFEISNLVKEGENRLVVCVNNQRRNDGVPGGGYDWLNFGGITRDVNLVEEPQSYIEDYSLQLKKGSMNEVLGWVKLNGSKSSQKISVKIPELKIDYTSTSNIEGIAKINFTGKFNLWCPENPKLYKVIIQSETDSISEEIGFRNIEIKNTKIYLNGKPIFLKSVNIHEENPYLKSRACNTADAEVLLNAAKELGCNLVRLSHYPHNEYTVKLAEKMGIMVWDEIPVYQHIEFSNPSVEKKINLMMNEMVHRDRNRCNVIIWCISNETYPSTKGRNSVLVRQTKECRKLDSTRLITNVSCIQGYNNNTVDVNDSIYNVCDFISVNEYYGWYSPWQGKPEDTKWKLLRNDKPVFISEFGGEAFVGSKGAKDEANSWTEEYQEKIYTDQVKMFKNIPNLCGVCPWILFDYRSLGRLHSLYQNGYNRKGLISEKGEKKKAWYVMKAYYSR